MGEVSALPDLDRGEVDSMRRGVADGIQRAEVDGRGEAADLGRSPQSRTTGKRRVPPAPDCTGAVLRMGASSPGSRSRSAAREEARPQALQDGSLSQGRSHATARRGRRAQRRDAAAQKGYDESACAPRTKTQ